MAPITTALVAFSLLLWTPASVAQKCATTIAPKGPTIRQAPGIDANVVTNDLTFPRGLIFDSAGHLLVVDRTVGIKALTLQGQGACAKVKSSKVVIANQNLNHGIELSQDGKTLYASTSDILYAYGYDPESASTTSAAKPLVTGMYNTDHGTRTILRSLKKDGTVVLNRGSAANFDPLAAKLSSGHGQVKAFDISAVGATPYDFTADGQLLAWGVRNNVGVGEHPVTGGIWTVENSFDDISRYGVDFHDQNPAEKLQYMGTLVNNTSPNQGSNFGYPYCFAAWLVKDVPKHGDLKRGEQFTIRPKIITDKGCQTKRTAPRLSFDAHMAPLDIKFTPQTGSKAYVTFHGCHDRDSPQGYKLSSIDYNSAGNPVAPSTSGTALTDLVEVVNKTACPSANCLRPVGIAFDNKGRLFFSSDYTGELYVVTKTGGF